MTELLMLKGLPASGKSTYAKELISYKGSRWVRVNKDDLRAMMGGWSKANEKIVVATRDAFINAALGNGKNVVVDDTNFHPPHETALRVLADQANAKFSVQFFDVHPVECIKRDGKRQNPVGCDVIMGMFMKYLAPEPPEYDLNLPDCIIADVDGTLAHMNGKRGPFQWDKVSLDDPDEEVIGIVNSICGDERGLTLGIAPHLICVTGRDGVAWDDTNLWLQKHLDVDFTLLSRDAGDNRPDYVIKRELYEAHVKGKYNVRFVLDDRDQTVIGWRALGLKCLQVGEGGF